jgi:predicted NBD/HSP70 family sugar kinase
VVLGAPGLVHPRTSDLVCAENIPGWSHDLLPELRSQLDGGGLAPEVLLENETNLAAVAELRVGVARGREDFVLFWLDEGVGGAVVLGGRVRRGMSGGAGEFGLLETAEGEFCATVVQGGSGKLAGRVATGVATVVKVLDPGLVVLGGSLGLAGGDALAGAVDECLRGLTKVATEVRASGVEGNAVLQGAVLTALDLTRDRVFSPAGS